MVRLIGGKSQASVPHQDSGVAHLELVAEAATKVVSGSAVAVASGRTFTAGLPDDLLQACEFYLGLACGAVDQEAEDVDNRHAEPPAFYRRTRRDFCHMRRGARRWPHLAQHSATALNAKTRPKPGLVRQQRPTVWVGVAARRWILHHSSQIRPTDQWTSPSSACHDFSLSVQIPLAPP